MYIVSIFFFTHKQSIVNFQCRHSERDLYAIIYWPGIRNRPTIVSHKRTMKQTKNYDNWLINSHFVFFFQCTWKPHLNNTIYDYNLSIGDWVCVHYYMCYVRRIIYTHSYMIPLYPILYIYILYTNIYCKKMVVKCSQISPALVRRRSCTSTIFANIYLNVCLQFNKFSCLPNDNEKKKVKKYQCLYSSFHIRSYFPVNYIHKILV